jgi:hypothetical protein
LREKQDILKHVIKQESVLTKAPKRNDEWLQKYGGRAQFHSTPTSASWLNQIEIWFGILSRKALKNASFAGAQELKEAIEALNYATQPAGTTHVQKTKVF